MFCLTDAQKDSGFQSKKTQPCESNASPTTVHNSDAPSATVQNIINVHMHFEPGSLVERQGLLALLEDLPKQGEQATCSKNSKWGLEPESGIEKDSDIPGQDHRPTEELVVGTQTHEELNSKAMQWAKTFANSTTAAGNGDKVDGFDRDTTLSVGIKTPVFETVKSEKERELEDRIESLQEKLETLSVENKTVKQQKEELEQEVMQLEQEVMQLKKQLQEKNVNIEDLKSILARKEKTFGFLAVQIQAAQFTIENR